MGHARPDVHLRINSGGDGPLYIVEGVVAQHLVIAHMHANGRQACETAEQRRGGRIRRIVSSEIGVN